MTWLFFAAAFYALALVSVVFIRRNQFGLGGIFAFGVTAIAGVYASAHSLLAFVSSR